MVHTEVGLDDDEYILFTRSSSTPSITRPSTGDKEEKRREETRTYLVCFYWSNHGAAGAGAGAATAAVTAVKGSIGSICFLPAPLLRREWEEKKISSEGKKGEKKRERVTMCVCVCVWYAGPHLIWWMALEHAIQLCLKSRTGHLSTPAVLLLSLLHCFIDLLIVHSNRPSFMYFAHTHTHSTQIDKSYASLEGAFFFYSKSAILPDSQSVSLSHL